MGEVGNGRVANGRRMGRGGLGVVSAAVVLAAVVAGAGAAGFVVLSAFGANHSSTSTVHDCSPPTLPQCRGIQNTTGQVVADPLTAGGLAPR
jgi:hypothetical protein